MLFNYHVDHTLPQNGEVFVFGSNYAGRHGAGAAKIALKDYGAVYGEGFGLHGQSYALPTKDEQLKTLTLKEVSINVGLFITHTYVLKDKKWFVTRVGCGLAGYDDSEIAPMFVQQTKEYLPKNCSFPEQWKPYLEGWFE